MRKRPGEFPGNGLSVQHGQLFCGLCGHNIGSSKQDVRKHCTEVKKHEQAKEAREASNTNRDEISTALAEFKSDVQAQTGKAPLGMTTVSNETQADRAECVEQFLAAGIPLAKIDKLRPWLQRRMSISLTASSHLS